MATIKSKINNNTSYSAGATTMAELMKSARVSFSTYHKGDEASGIITKLDKSEILVDINAKTEAVVLEKDKKILGKILASVKLGDKVSVRILNPEGEMGNPVVSMRKFVDDMVWDKLYNLKKNQEVLDATVNSVTKGGYLVTALDGVSGFLPNSHISNLENPGDLIGKKIKTVVLEANRELRKIIFSQKQVLGIDDFKKSVKGLKEGQEIEAVITNIASFGIFLSVSVEKRVVEGFIHASEISWENITNVPEEFKVGRKLKAVVTGFDEESRRVQLSVKRLTPDPFEEKIKEFTEDKKIKASVTKIISSGILLDLGEGIMGIIKKEKIPANVTYKEGQEIEVTVSGVDKKRHRVDVAPVLLEKPIGYR